MEAVCVSLCVCAHNIVLCIRYWLAVLGWAWPGPSARITILYSHLFRNWLYCFLWFYYNIKFYFKLFCSRLLLPPFLPPPSNFRGFEFSAATITKRTCVCLCVCADGSTFAAVECDACVWYASQLALLLRPYFGGGTAISLQYCHHKSIKYKVRAAYTQYKCMKGLCTRARELCVCCASVLFLFYILNCIV